MSPILGDALTISRWWLTSHRRSLYNYEDQFQQAPSSVLFDRGDGFKNELEDSNSVRVVEQQFLACCLLLPDGHRDKNLEKTGCSIQAVLKVVSVPVRFWDRGACYFVVSYSCWSKWMRLQRCFEGSTLRDSTPYVSVNRWFFAVRPV